MKRLQGFIASFLLTGLLGTSHAALTTAEVREHFGRCVAYGLANGLLTKDQAMKLVRGYVLIAREFVPNGTFATQALRLEGVQTNMREAFTAIKGGNPTDGGVGQHGYKHWLVDDVGLTQAEVNSLEPSL